MKKRKARLCGRHLTWESASLGWVPPIHSHVEPPKRPAVTPTVSRPSPQFGARSPPRGLSFIITLPLGDLVVNSGFSGRSVPQAWSPWSNEARIHSSHDPISQERDQHMHPVGVPSWSQALMNGAIHQGSVLGLPTDAHLWGFCLQAAPSGALISDSPTFIHYRMRTSRKPSLLSMLAHLVPDSPASLAACPPNPHQTLAVALPPPPCCPCPHPTSPCSSASSNGNIVSLIPFLLPPSFPLSMWLWSITRPMSPPSALPPPPQLASLSLKQGNQPPGTFLP